MQKYDEHGQPIRKKGRYVARGFSQREGIDFQANHTYAPVASPECIRTVLNFACHRKAHTHQLDIGNFYIVADLDVPIYMEIPLGMREYYESINRPFPEGQVFVELKKSIYGLVQSGRLAHDVLVKCLKKCGFEQASEPCLFLRKEADGSTSMVAVYVDDLVIVFDDEDVMAKFKKDLAESHPLFTIEDRGIVKHLLGVHIEYDRENGILEMSQEAYIDKLFARFNLERIVKQHIPMSADDAMMFARPAKWEEKMRDGGHGDLVDGDELCDATLYKAVIGSGLHAIKWTRPDATTAIHYQATAMHRPTKLALAVALKTLRYLYDTKHLKLKYDCSTLDPVFTAYSDADLAGWHNGRSRTGWCVKFGKHTDCNAAIVWKSKLQIPIFDNTPDSEQAALMEVGHVVFWLRNMAHECGFSGYEPVMTPGHSISGGGEHHDGRDAYATSRENVILTDVFCDNKPTVQRTKNPMRWRRERKVHICYTKCVEYCWDESELRIIHLHHIDGKKNIADMWTKVSKDKQLFYGMRMQIMNLPELFPKKAKI